MTEELTTGKLRNHRRAVQYHQVPLVRAAIQRVNEPGQKLLARTAFTGDQDRAIGEHRHFNALTHHLRPGPAAANQIVLDHRRRKHLINQLPPFQAIRNVPRWRLQLVPSHHVGRAGLQQFPDFFAVQQRTPGHNRQDLSAPMIAGFVQKVMRFIRDLFEQSDTRCIDFVRVTELGLHSRFTKTLKHGRVAEPGTPPAYVIPEALHPTIPFTPHGEAR